MTAAVQENVLVQLDYLRRHPSVASRLSQGQLELHAWVYASDMGQTFVYDPDSQQFVALDAE
jgi:carbonic anhydrase